MLRASRGRPDWRSAWPIRCDDQHCAPHFDAAAKLGRRRRRAGGRQQQRSRLAKLAAAELTCGHHDRRQAGARRSAALSAATPGRAPACRCVARAARVARAAAAAGGGGLANRVSLGSTRRSMGATPSRRGEGAGGGLSGDRDLDGRPSSVYGADDEDGWGGLGDGDGSPLLQLSTALLPGGDLNRPANGNGGNGGESALRWMQLTLDSTVPTRVYVHTSRGGLHVLELPWLHDWGLYLVHETAAAGSASAADPSPPPTPPADCGALVLVSSDPAPLDGSSAQNPFPPPNPSIANHPDARFRKPSGVVGIAPLRDPSLGDSIFAMTNDGKAVRVQMEVAMSLRGEEGRLRRRCPRRHRGRTARRRWPAARPAPATLSGRTRLRFAGYRTTRWPTRRAAAAA